MDKYAIIHLLMNREEIIKLGNLSRLKLTDEEVDTFQAEIGSILEYVKQIETLDTTGLKSEFEQKNVMREDGEPHESGMYTERILNEAPDKEENYIKVKQIFE